MAYETRSLEFCLVITLEWDRFGLRIAKVEIPEAFGMCSVQAW
jgi:hypothetical protein